MLSRAFEWYRVVNVVPSSEIVESRKAAARAVIKAIDDASDLTFVFDSAAGVVVGFERAFTQQAPIVASLVDIIRAHDSAIASDLAENALELRVVAALAIGEILARDGDRPENDATLIAAVLQSGLGIRTLPDGKYLRQMIEELAAAAQKTRVAGARRRRSRSLSFSREIEKLPEASDLAAAWKVLVPALKAALREVAAQSAMDREEIDLLWWLFTAASTTTGKKLSDMPPGAAALCAGAELANECLVPATPSLESMVRKAFETGRKPKDAGERGIESLAQPWDSSVLVLLVPNDGDRTLARRHPSLFPLSWLCSRLLDSNQAQGWLSEFEARTSLSGTHTSVTTEWAIQAFRERVALRQASD
jgi:hypothetical protein